MFESGKEHYGACFNEIDKNNNLIADIYIANEVVEAYKKNPNNYWAIEVGLHELGHTMVPLIFKEVVNKYRKGLVTENFMNDVKNSFYTYNKDDPNKLSKYSYDCREWIANNFAEWALKNYLTRKPIGINSLIFELPFIQK